MKVNRLAVSLGVAAALGAGVIGQAHADAVAQSDLNISNFVLKNAGGAALTFGGVASDFTSITFTDQLTNTANLGGPAVVQTASTNVFIPFVDAPMACVGACGGLLQNNFVPATIPPAPSATYSRSDSLLTGAAINVPSVPIVAGAAANTIGETTLLGSSTGGSTSAIVFNSTLVFTLAHAVNSLEISFNADKYLRVWTSPGSATGTSASADVHWTLSLSNAAGEIVEWAPNGIVDASLGLTEIADGCNLNQTTGAGANQPRAPIVCTGSLFDATLNVPLAAGVQYTVLLGQSIQTQATSIGIPEPATLALLGAALVGIGLGTRRRNA